MDLKLYFARRREIDLGLRGTRRRSLSGERPNMSELRIVLLGKDALANCRVRNVLLRIDDIEALPADVEQLTKNRRQLKNRLITVINIPHLLQPDLLNHQLTQGVRECVYLSDPGPHAIILVLQHNDFNVNDINRVKHVLEQFGDKAIKHTMVLTTDTEALSSSQTSVKKTDAMLQLIKECGSRHLQFDQTKPQFHFEIIQIIEKIKEENEEFLTCEVFDDAQEGTLEDKEQSTSEGSVREKEQEEEDNTHEEAVKPKEGKGNDGGAVLSFLQSKREQQLERIHPNKTVSGKEKLNLVLCGINTKLKISVSKVLRNKPLSTHQREPSLVCVEKEDKVNGRQVTVVELPALTELPEEEVINQTLKCVSLCDSGVHTFLLIIPVGPLTDRDKIEMEKIQKMFCSKDHFMVLFTTDFTVDRTVTEFVTSTESQRVVSLYGSWYSVMGLKEQRNSKQISDLLECIEAINKEPYSLLMYIKAQEKRARHELEEKLSKKESKIKELQHKIQQAGLPFSDEEDEPSDSGSLRIVLIGKTGNGKSETGNTILGKVEFHTETSSDSVTTVCMKGVGEFQGKSVAVVDTPGLFDTTLSNEQVQEEIVKCVSLSAPGPHVFIIVLSVGRFTKEEKDTVDLIKGIFGAKAAQFSIVLFTRGDDLEKQNKTIDQYLQKSKSAELKKLIRDCGNRFLVFNNNKKEDQTQVTLLFDMIEEVKNSNKGQYFTNSMFEEAEMSIKRRVENILKEKEREIQAKYEIVKENMMKRLEKEKRAADKERMKMENQFREREETLRKEFEEKEKAEQKKREEENKRRSDEEKRQKSKNDQKINEMKTEIENQKSLYEKQLKEKEVEDKKREEKYKQDQQKLIEQQKCAMDKLRKEQQEETERRRLDEQRRICEEEEERQRWQRRIKEHENDKKEIQEMIKKQQREWEEERKIQMKKQEEEERKRKERHEEQLREKQEEMDKMRKKSERERDEERQNIEEERQQWRDTERRQREQKERECEEMKKHYELLAQERKKEWEISKGEDDVRREEERKKWEKMITDLKREQEEENSRRDTEEKDRKKREEKERNKMKEEYEQKIKDIKKTHEDEARKQAEEFNDFRENKEMLIKDLKKKLEESQTEYELLKRLFMNFQGQEGEKGFWANCVIL